MLSSHLLEHLGSVEDVALAWNEFHRVADAVFVSLPGKDSLMAWLAPEHNLWVQQVGSGILKVEERWRGGRKALVQAGGF